MERLLEAIEGRTAAVGVIGLGYVGLPLAVELERLGFRVLGIDVDPHRVATLQQGKSYVRDVPHDRVAQAIRRRLSVTADYASLRAADVVVVCVPTPLRKTRDPDLSHVVAATEGVRSHLRPGMLVILESTTYPGTTREVVKPALESTGLVCGRDFFLAFSPERVDPGNAVYTTVNIPKVVGGMTPECTRVASAFYAALAPQVVTVSSPDAAEMVKLLENTFRSVNIALVNEMAILCERMGLDVWEVIQAAATKPFGFMPFYPGPGIGGHCIPLDPSFLSWRAKVYGFYHRFIELAADINGNMPRHVVSRLGDLLNAFGRSLNGARILLLGVAYKPDVGDTRESPAIEVAHLLRERGAQVEFCDPLVSELTLPDGVVLKAEPLTRERLAAADCAVLLTHHRDFPYDLIASAARLIFDTRNAFAGNPAPHIFRLGNAFPMAGGGGR